ncbi:hypothetical protein SY85_14050 [Flavisolibacter tropicus]|uniref:Uncharacterized protein n=1 Tax=Flavisolibacter tropicus TaxID=1492898 RepID=A0A172TWQ3_9BACT|nr:hypothetical protein SY85_14050 [Flavisolibacter tropicus]
MLRVQDRPMLEIQRRSQSLSHQAESLRKSLDLRNMTMRQAVVLEVITPQSLNGVASFLHLE